MNSTSGSHSGGTANVETSNPKQELPANSETIACEDGDIETLKASDNNISATSYIDNMFSAAASRGQVKTIE